jgi:hypothetical protein
MGALLGTEASFPLLIHATRNFLYNDPLGCKNRIVIERYYCSLSQLTQALAPKLEKLALGLSLRQGARPTQQAQRSKVVSFAASLVEACLHTLACAFFTPFREEIAKVITEPLASMAVFALENYCVRVA